MGECGAGLSHFKGVLFASRLVEEQTLCDAVLHYHPFSGLCIVRCARDRHREVPADHIGDPEPNQWCDLCRSAMPAVA